MKNSFVLLMLGTMISVSTWDSDARGAIMSFTPSQDNSIYAENNNSSGAKGFIFVGRTNGTASTTIRRALVQFDLSSIPAGSSISSVTLKLERSFGGPSASGDILELHPVSAAWGEGTSTGGGQGGTGYAPTTNSATWNHRLYSGTTWTNAGGDFGATSGTLTLDLNASFTVPSQTGMVTDVQNWVNSPSLNFGWLLRYTDEDFAGTARQFYSREASILANRPTLTIDFTAVPEPNSCLLLAAAAIVASTYRSRRRSFKASSVHH